MSDLQKYVEERKKKDPEFANDYDEGYKNFKIGLVFLQILYVLFEVDSHIYSISLLCFVYNLTLSETKYAE